MNGTDITNAPDFALMLGALGSVIAELDETDTGWESDYGGGYAGPGELVSRLGYLPGAQWALIDDDRRLDWGVRFQSREHLPSIGALSESDRVSLARVVIAQLELLASDEKSANDSERAPLAMLVKVMADDPWDCADGASDLAASWAEGSGSGTLQYFGLIWASS